MIKTINRCLLFSILGMQLLYAQNKKTVDSSYVKVLLDSAYALEVEVPTKALKLYDEAIAISKKLNYGIGAAKATQYKGIVYADLGDYDNALINYEKAIVLAQKTNYLHGQAASNVNIGNIHQFKGNVERAIPYYIKGVELFKKRNDSINISQTLLNLGGLFDMIGQSNKNIYYLNEANKFAPNTALDMKGYIYSNLANAHIDRDSLVQAFYNLKIADSISSIVKDPLLTHSIDKYYGTYYFRNNEYVKAKKSFEKSLLPFNEINNLLYEGESLNFLAEISLALNQNREAITYSKRALKIGKETASNNLLSYAYKHLAQAYSADGQLKQAYDALNKHMTFKDSILQIDKTKAINQLQEKYESEKKDNAIANQLIEIEKKNNKILVQEKRNQRLIVILIFFLGLLIFGYYILRQRQLLKDNKISQLQKQKKINTITAILEGEENERVRISRELHDGINGDLSALKYGIESKAIKKDRSMLVSDLDKIIHHVRNISHNLAPPVLQEATFEEALQSYLARIKSETALDCDFQSFGKPPKLPMSFKLNLFRIIQEGINNILKHAQATEVLVQLNYHDSNVKLTIEDNGKGFDSRESKHGIGLMNIKSRANYLNGTFDITSDNNGTALEVILPSIHNNND